MEKKDQGSCGFGKKCKNGYTPINRKLYKKIKIKAIKNSSKWPSRYSSYELVNEYKKRGGKYTCKTNRFGAPLGSFYPQGAQQNTFLTPEVKKCLNVIYGPRDSSYTSSSYAPDTMNSLGFGKKTKSKSKSVIRYLRSFLK